MVLTLKPKLKRLNMMLWLLLLPAKSVVGLAAIPSNPLVEGLPPAHANGIGTLQPRFSWTIADAPRNISQASYRVIVSSRKYYSVD